MKGIVALSAHRDQILLAILSTLAPELLVMDLKLIGPATALASPSISP
jgi:hypothetical protein